MIQLKTGSATSLRPSSLKIGTIGFLYPCHRSADSQKERNSLNLVKSMVRMQQFFCVGCEHYSISCFFCSCFRQSVEIELGVTFILEYTFLTLILPVNSDFYWEGSITDSFDSISRLFILNDHATMSAIAVISVGQRHNVRDSLSASIRKSLREQRNLALAREVVVVKLIICSTWSGMYKNLSKSFFSRKNKSKYYIGINKKFEQTLMLRE